MWSPWGKGKSSTGCPEKWDKITSLVKSIKASWRRWHSKLSTVSTRSFGRGSCNTSWCNVNTGPYNHHYHLCQLRPGQASHALLDLSAPATSEPSALLLFSYHLQIRSRTQTTYLNDYHWKSLSFSPSLSLVTQSCPTLVTPWTVACQAPLSMGFSRQEYWSGLLLPSPGDLPNPGFEPWSCASQTDSLPTKLWGNK